MHNKKSGSLTRYLIFFFARARQIKLSAALLAAASFAVMLVFLLIQTGQLTGAQTVARDLGSFTHKVSVPVPIALKESHRVDFAQLSEQVTKAGATHVAVGAEAYQVYFGTGDEERAFLTSMDWQADTLPERISLLEGRLPQNADEITVTPELAAKVSSGMITFGQNSISFKIVGIYDENFIPAYPAALLHNDGWAKFQALTADEDYDLQLNVYFDTDSDDPLRYLEPISDALAAAGFEQPDPELMLQSVTSREQLLNDAPTLYSEIVLMTLLVPLGAGVIGGFLTSRFVRRIHSTTHSLGVMGVHRPAIAAAALFGVLGSVLGASVAVAVGYLLRPALTDIRDEQIGEYHDIHLLIPALIATGCIGLLAGFASLARSIRVKKPRAIGKYVPNLSQLLPALSILTVFVSVYFVQLRDNNLRVLSIYFFAFAIVLLAPYALWIFTRLRFQHEMSRLGMLRLRAKSKGNTSIMITLATILMLGFSTLSLSHSLATAFNDEQVPLLPPNSALLRVHDLDVDAASLADAVTEQAGSAPVTVHALSVGTEYRDGALHALETVADVERFLQISLTPEEAAMLEQGALLRLKPFTGTEVALDQGTNLTAFMPVDTPQVYGVFGSGVLLTNTAEQRSLAFLEIHTWLYTNLTTEQAQILAAAPITLGFHPGWLALAEPDYQLAESWQVLTIGITAGAVAGLFLLGYANGVARNLRGVSAALISMGAPRRWIYRLIFTEIGTVTIAAVATALASTVFAILLVTLNVSTLKEIRLPWLSLALIIATLTLMCVAAVALAGRKLELTERGYSD